MTYRLRVGPGAETQIREAASWWLENRSKAPLAFAEDLERAFLLITSLPGTGERVRHSSRAGVRRVLLGRVRCYLYYEIDDNEDTVEVLSLWHTSRTGKPAL